MASIINRTVNRSVAEAAASSGVAVNNTLTTTFGTTVGVNGLIKMRVPFFRRTVGNTADGMATFYIGSTIPDIYLPALNDTVIISHTEVPTASTSNKLANKLNSTGSNTVTGLFQGQQTTSDAVLIAQTDTYFNYFIVKYTDTTFSLNSSDGDCRGFIEYFVSPSTYTALKQIEASVVVNDTVPFDDNDGYNFLYGSNAAFTGSTTQVLPMFFVERNATNTIFANVLKSLNLPVSDLELSKYTRTKYGYLTDATSTQIPTVYIAGKAKYWNELVSDTLPTGIYESDLITNPTSTGSTGEYYKTVLQTIGSYDFVTTAYSKLPVPNDLYLVMDIPANMYGAIIDGKSIKLTIPYWSGSTSSSYIKQYLGIKNTYLATQNTLELYGTYNKSGLANSLDKKLSEIDLSMKDIGEPINLSEPTTNYESNVVLLFNDTISGKPYENPTVGSWADGHNDVIDGTRVFTPNAQLKDTYDYFNDECVGAVFLDKGFIVITHPVIVDSIFINAFNGKITTGGTVSQPLKSYDLYGNVSRSSSLERKNVGTGFGFRTYTGSTNFIFNRDSTGNVQWENTQFIYTGGTAGVKPTTPYLEFVSYNYEKSLNIVCLASSDEFYKSTNDTAKELMGVSDTTDFANFKSSNENLEPIIITQLGIHDDQGNLLAVCKPTQPIKKYWYDVVSFNVRIRL